MSVGQKLAKIVEDRLGAHLVRFDVSVTSVLAIRSVTSHDGN